MREQLPGPFQRENTMDTRIPRAVIWAALCYSLASAARAAPPVAPVITVGVNNVKQLQFDWASVPHSNWYELWFKANAGARWVKYQETPAQRPIIRITVSVHLLDWRVALYRVAACNPSGCTSSNQAEVSNLASAAIGYFKPNGVGNNHAYGHTTAVSADGLTFAVVTGETIGSAVESAVVQVYRRTPGGAWYRQARLAPSAVQAQTSLPFLGTGLALSGDGNLLALGLPADDRLGLNTPADTGAVYLFRRTGTTWSEEQKIEGNVAGESLGRYLDLDDAGETLAAWRSLRESPVLDTPGAVSLYRHSASGWNLVTTLTALRAGSPLNRCEGLALSGNGQRLVRVCSNGRNGGSAVQVFVAPDWTLDSEFTAGVGTDHSSIDTDAEGNRIVVRTDARMVRVYRRAGAGWNQEGFFGQPPFSETGDYGTALAISRDGTFIAIGDPRGNVAGSGRVYPPYDPGSMPTGNVTVVQFRNGFWQNRSGVKPNTETMQRFGHSLALGDNGRILVVGAPFDASAATGIDGDQSDTSASERGAVWLY